LGGSLTVFVARTCHSAIGQVRPKIGQSALRHLLPFSAILLIFESGHLSDGGIVACNSVDILQTSGWILRGWVTTHSGRAQSGGRREAGSHLKLQFTCVLAMTQHAAVGAKHYADNSDLQNEV
jgi:hypothetical protein